MGKGVVSSLSTNHKVNGKSLTEEKLIGVDDAMAKIFYTITAGYINTSLTCDIISRSIYKLIQLNVRIISLA